MKTIDDVTDSKKQKLLAVLSWPTSVQAAVSTWPCYNVIRELNSADMQQKKCSACSRTGVAVRVLLYGQPYNSTTLEGSQPDPQAANEKVRNCQTLLLAFAYRVGQLWYLVDCG